MVWISCRGDDTCAGFQSHYVRIGAAGADRSFTIVFFRHDDGSWNVFPAETSRPAMRAYALAA
jgi:hypothetical protein